MVLARATVAIPTVVPLRPLTVAWAATLVAMQVVTQVATSAVEERC